MATIICPKCLTLRHWSAARGAHLSDIRCVCGSGFVKAQFRDLQYQLPLPKPPKASPFSAPETSSGTIFASLGSDTPVRHPAKAGDLAIWKRQGECGAYEVRVLAFRGDKVKIQLLRREGDVPLSGKPKPVWTKTGFLRLLPQNYAAAA